VEKLARGVDAVHQAQVVHRDLKPANVLLAADGTPKVSDFGLARKLDEQGYTRTGAIMGTPCYMAPEQAAGLVNQVGPAADVYALGAILYECLTGQPPFRGANVLETLEQVRSQDPLPPRELQPHIPRDLNLVCLKCLQKLPADRYPSAQGLAEDLRRVSRGETPLARKLTRTERVRRLVGSYYGPTLTSFFGALVILLGWGLLLGVFSFTSIPIDRTRADVWVGSPGLLSMDLGGPIREGYLVRVASQPEVEQTEVYLQGFAYWSKRRGNQAGGKQLCMVIGSRLGNDALGAIDILTPEMRGKLIEPGAIIMDESERMRLGVYMVGDTGEVSSTRVRVVGFTKGVRSLSGPYLFCSISTARALLRFSDDQITYVLAKCRNKEDAPKVAHRLQEKYKRNIAVMTSDEFSVRTRMHWLTSTKFGVPVGAIVLIVLMLGAVIIGHQLYTTAMRQHERTPGRLAALSRLRLTIRLLAPALIVGILGSVLATAVVWNFTRAVASFTPIRTDWWLYALATLLTLIMAFVGGLMCARRMRRFILAKNLLSNAR
jgi:putative ABC transport system permease protein